MNKCFKLTVSNGDTKIYGFNNDGDLLVTTIKKDTEKLEIKVIKKGGQAI